MVARAESRRTTAICLLSEIVHSLRVRLAESATCRPYIMPRMSHFVRSARPVPPKATPARPPSPEMVSLSSLTVPGSLAEPGISTAGV